jgi:hypothetical protein
MSKQLLRLRRILPDRPGRFEEYAIFSDQKNLTDALAAAGDQSYH